MKEGFKDAVGAFQEESVIDPGVDMAMLDDQIKIRDAVEAGSEPPHTHTHTSTHTLTHTGLIQEAVELVNDVDPEILDTNPTLFFHLQQQQLLELIKEVCNLLKHL